MGKRDLVSIVTPCYNTGKYVHRLLESVLSQTYPNIEMFVIDDGSSDNSAEIVKSYIPRFENRGYQLTLIRQNNSGQSVALREGMKLIKGKYFVWPDSDDFYASRSAISMMVDAFERLGENYGLVRTQENLLEDDTFKIIGCNGKEAKAEYDKLQLFEDCLFCKNNFFFCSGAYMADFQKLKDSTSLDIYTDKNAGQNWQLMLPLLYNYKCYTIQEPLYNVVARLTSHSRGQYAGYERTLAKIASYEQTILETLKRIKELPFERKEKYVAEIRKKYCRLRIWYSFQYRRRADFERFYNEGLEIGCAGKKEKLLKVLFSVPFVVKGLLYLKHKLVR